MTFASGKNLVRWSGILRTCFCLLLTLIAVSPVLAQDLGINGTVQDSNKVALPGVSVKLQGAGTNEQIVYTDQDGKFAFTGLKPGAYTLTAELSGFQPITTQLNLEASSIRPLEIILPSATSVQEAVTVKGEGEDLLPKNETTTRNEVTDQQLASLPLAEQKFQDAIPLIPSVVRGPDGTINIGGARSNESGLLVNGSNVTDPVTGQYAIDLPIEAVENVRVYTNPYSAEFGKFTGGLTSVSTKSGEDHYKFELNDFFPRFHFTDGLQTQGIEAFTPRIRVSGPTGIKNLYFSEAVTYRYLRTFFDDLPAGQDFIKTTAFDSLTQLDYKPSASHQMTFTLSFFPDTTRNEKLSTFLPVPSTPDFKQDGYNIGVADRHFFKNGSFLESTFSYKVYNVDVLPKEGEDLFVIAPEGDQGSYFENQTRDSDRAQFSQGYTFQQFALAGNHLVKVGYDLARTSYTGSIQYSPLEVRREDGSLFESIQFVGGGSLGQHSTEFDNYVQDQWSLSDQLMLNAGLRLDYDSISGDPKLSPRFSFSYGPAQLPHTVFKGGIGVFYDKAFLNAPDFEQYPDRIVNVYDENENLVNTTTIVNRINGAIQTPRGTTWNLEADQQVTSKLLLRTNYLVRDGSHQFLFLPQGNVFLLTNQGSSHYWQWEFTTEIKLSADYNLYFSYVRSHATGDSNDFNSYLGNFPDPLIRENAFANQLFDTPNRFLFWGVLMAPYKLRFAPIVEIRNGFPYSAVNQEQQFVGPRNELRFPVFAQLDLRVTRTFKVLSKYDLTVGVKVLNVMNKFNPRDVQNNIDSPAFGTFYNGVGRTFRGAFEIKY